MDTRQHLSDNTPKTDEGIPDDQISHRSISNTPASSRSDISVTSCHLDISTPSHPDTPFNPPDTPLIRSAGFMFTSTPETPSTRSSDTPLMSPKTPAGGRTPGGSRRRSFAFPIIESDDPSDPIANKRAKMGGVRVSPDGKVLDEKGRPKRPPMFCLVLQVQKNGLKQDPSTLPPTSFTTYLFSAQKSGHKWYFESCFNTAEDKVTGAGECLLSEDGTILFWSPHSGTYGEILYGGKTREQIDEMKILPVPHIDYLCWEKVKGKLAILPMGSASPEGDLYTNGYLSPKRNFADVFNKWHTFLLAELKMAVTSAKESKDNDQTEEVDMTQKKDSQPTQEMNMSKKIDLSPVPHLEEDPQKKGQFNFPQGIPLPEKKSATREKVTTSQPDASKKPPRAPKTPSSAASPAIQTPTSTSHASRGSAYAGMFARSFPLDNISKNEVEDPQKSTVTQSPWRMLPHRDEGS